MGRRRPATRLTPLPSGLRPNTPNCNRLTIRIRPRTISTQPSQVWKRRKRHDERRHQRTQEVSAIPRSSASATKQSQSTSISHVRTRQRIGHRDRPRHRAHSRVHERRCQGHCGGTNEEIGLLHLQQAVLQKGGA